MADGHFVFRPAGKERLEKTTTHVSMQSADAVDRAASAKREISHVELLLLIVGMCASKRHHVAQADVYRVGVNAQILGDQI